MFTDDERETLLMELLRLNYHQTPALQALWDKLNSPQQEQVMQPEGHDNREEQPEMPPMSSYGEEQEKPVEDK